MQEIRTGKTFVHKTLLDPDWNPAPGQKYADAPKAICRITAVRQGKVYYGIGADATKAHAYAVDDYFVAHSLGEWILFDEEGEQITPTGHVIGATYRSSYWGGTYKVIGPDMRRDWGVEVECVEPGGGAHQTPGTRWTHSTMLDRRDQRLS